MISASAAFSAPTALRAPITTRRTSRRTAPIRSSPNDSMSIQEYIEEHALGKKVEDVINAAVKAKAAEPISFMVRALPAISIFARHRSDDYRTAVSSGRGAGFGTGFARVFTTERSRRSSTPRNHRETTASSVARRAALERRTDQPTIGTIFAEALRRGEKIESDLRKSPLTPSLPSPSCPSIRRLST